MKVTRRSLALVRQIAAKTGEKQYALVERLLRAEKEKVLPRGRQRGRTGSA